MAPMLLERSVPEAVSTVSAKAVSICSDRLVVPSDQASKRTKELWWLHGHPHSKRYSDPKLVTLAALIRHAGNVYKGRKAFLYPISAEVSTPYRSMTWDEFDRVTETIASSYARKLKNVLDESNTAQKQPTIALLGSGKTLEYWCTQLALQKLGVRVLLLAESNALDAMHFLLATCNASAVITDSKNAGTNTNGIRKLDMVEEIPERLDAVALEVDAFKFRDSGNVWERHAFIIHSSGSTGMPKPIVHTNRSMMLIARMYRLFQDYHIENWFLLFPLYHIAGISIALSNLPNGQILSFPPLSWPPSSSTIFEAWKTLDSMGHPVECVHCAPTLIENMCEYISENGGDFSPLVGLKLLQPGGAALSDSIIQLLTSNGVNVKTTYGSTEIGPPFRTIPHAPHNPRCYTFRNLYPDNKFLKMEEVEEGVYECVVYKGFELAAELWEGKSDAEPYRTNDLFIQDPPGSGYFVLRGRKDDILVHSNGENTSAGPLQLDIQSSSKIICRALALGHSKPCVSLLVEVNEGYNPKDQATQAKVWEAVQKANVRYPSHSQIMRSMICFLPKGSTLPVTPKGNVKRKEVERIYASQISALYSNDILPTSNSTSQQPLSEYTRTLLAGLANVPETSISDWTTLYDLGIDSRLALSLRSSLSSHLNRQISLSTLFENPSISKLVAVFSRPPSETPSCNSTDFKPPSSEAINRIISTLSSEFSTWPPRSLSSHYPFKGKETILLTGASGSLGTSLIEALSSSPKVGKIYAMVRGPNRLSKLKTAFESRGMDAGIGRGKVEVLNFSMKDPLLGVDVETYLKLAKEVTVVVGNAWKMDFNQSVEEFEADCLRNTMNLLRLCHAGRPKTFAFTSSISTCMGPGHTSTTVPESPIGSDPNVALATGYAQSKYIVERITQAATQHLGLDIKLLRVGQLCGHTKTGHWSTNEMWPILFVTSANLEMNTLPRFEGKSVDWIPVDIAASTISEILLAPKPKPTSMSKGEGGEYNVHNITNPHPIPFSSLLTMLQPLLSSSNHPHPLEIIDMKAWVARLNSLADRGMDPVEVPGLRLLQFFENMATEEGDGDEGGKVLLFETETTRGVSASLKVCGAFCGEWIEGNVRVWRERGFLR